MSAPRKKSAGRKKAGPEQADGSSAQRKASPTRPDEMSDEVIEFITAVDDYKRLKGRPFPSWSEVLEIVKALGYCRSS